MNKFDHIFFSRYVDVTDSIEKVFHRHIFVVLEDMILWIFFGLFIPVFLYAVDAFSLRESLAEWQVIIWVIGVYILVIYKLCDWYYDVWIATEKSMIAVQWKWFTSDLLYIPYDKIEGVEVRTKSIFYAFIGMSDVIIKLAGDDRFILHAAARSGDIISYIQGIGSHHAKKGEDNREPFEILVDTLSDVVKGQMIAGGKDYITHDYIEKLESTLHEEDVIDLRRPDEKILIDHWKKHNAPTDPDAHSDETHPGGHH